MEKIDLKKEFKAFYKPARQPEVVEVPSFSFLMIDGAGSTESEGFAATIQALFAVSYKAKFLSKKELGKDYVVMPLEGLWWADDFNDFVTGNKEKWKWTLMIMQPDFMTAGLAETARQEAMKKKEIPEARQLRLQTFHEGLSTQMMHIGPFSEEGPNIQKLHQLIREQGGTFDGQRQKHHEIYLSDFRRVAPEKMKTVLRQPFTIK